MTGAGGARAVRAEPRGPVAPLPELGCWLALIRAPGLGPRAVHAAVERMGSARALLEAGEPARADLGLPQAAREYLRAPDWGAVESDLEWAAGPGNHALTLRDAAYPRLLREITDPPPVLFVRGDPAVLGAAQLAVVGSRNPTRPGRETAEAFAEHLAGQGLAISSGLAVGIDAAAHQGALRAGRTVAVAGTGLDRVYPAAHRALADVIAERGALVSEFPPGTPPRRDHFPRRNRLISGLALGVLVVEAGVQSGSLITARHALEQGREVLAIPGSIHNPLARGCHRLIREGAKLVETAADVIEELGALAGVEASAPADEAAAAPAEPALDGDYRRLLENLGYEPAGIDTLAARAGLTPEAVSSMLLILEMRGLAAPMPGGRYVRAR